MESPVRVTGEGKRSGGGKRAHEEEYREGGLECKGGGKRRARKHGGVARVQLVVLKFVVFGRSIKSK